MVYYRAMSKPIRCLRTVILVSALLLAPQAARAGDSLAQALRDIGTDLRLMCVAAHPDDEDGATLAKYRMEYGVKTYAVIATRGEGGQNEIGPELYGELGVLRTREQLRSAAVIRAEVRFLDLPEFGYSKTLEETFEVWGRENTVRRLVRAIRETRPDVIITNHGTRKDHGHHQAVGAALLEAFDAAADPDAFPELAAAGLAPWRVARLYQRRAFDSDPPAENTVTVDIERIDAETGVSYAEIAARALEEHRSQGMDFFINGLRNGDITASYEVARDTGDVSGAADTPAPAGALLAGLSDRVPAADRALAEDPPPLDELRAAILRRAAEADAGPRRERLMGAAAALLGLRLEAVPASDEVVPGQRAAVTAILTASGAPRPAQAVFRVEAPSWGMEPVTGAPVALDENGKAEAILEFEAPAGLTPTIPHAERLLDAGFPDPQWRVTAEATVDGAPVVLTVPVRVDVAPPIGVAFEDAPVLVRSGVQEAFEFRLRVTNHTAGPREARLFLSPSSGLKTIREWEQRVIPVAFEAGGESRVITLPQEIQPHIPERDLYLTVTVEGQDGAVHGLAQVADIAVPDNLRVGVVRSYDDTMLRTLARLGVAHETIESGDFVPERLDRFQTILVDIRAYHARPDLAENHRALLDYAHRGGALIVMYQKTREWDERYAPYPLRVSGNRVTQPDAPVTPLVPDHRLFTAPNAIGASDWLGWRHERGLYFPDQWAAEYTPLLACSDPGEDLPPGGMLYAEYGEGRYLYTPLAWYRQWRELHPGALRMFANMLALGDRTGRTD